MKVEGPLENERPLLRYQNHTKIVGNVLAPPRVSTRSECSDASTVAIWTCPPDLSRISAAASDHLGSNWLHAFYQGYSNTQVESDSLILENMVHESRSLQVESWIATIHVVIGRRDFGIVIAFLKFELVKDNESLLSVNNANARFSRCFSLNCSVKGIVLSEPPISSLRNFSGFRTPFWLFVGFARNLKNNLAAYVITRWRTPSLWRVNLVDRQYWVLRLYLWAFQV